MVAASWVISDTRLSKYRGFAVPIVALISVLIADLAVFSLGGLTLYDAVLSASEASLAAGTTFFMMRSLTVAEHRENLLCLNNSDISCLIITFAIAMMALG